MQSTATSPFAWWEARRLRYNFGLVKAGTLAFIVFVIVCSALLPEDADLKTTPFMLVPQAILYFGGANVCYFLGPLSERVVRPADPEKYRHSCYRLGFWFSVLLPFSFPALLIVLALFDPGYWKQSQ
ncbi:MAG TPA: hypothetical protein VN765_08545 [Candidatus Acidoferrum sp.]|nr:hypothetical protein [Candidatus Acidoferrum sp.]